MISRHAEMRMRKLAILLALAIAAPSLACADDYLKPYTLTAADAAAINKRRPGDWIPRVTAGDVFAVDKDGLVHIPTMAAGTQGGWVAIEDLQPKAPARP